MVELNKMVAWRCVLTENGEHCVQITIQLLVMWCAVDWVTVAMANGYFSDHIMIIESLIIDNHWSDGAALEPYFHGFTCDGWEQNIRHCFTFDQYIKSSVNSCAGSIISCSDCE